MLERPHSHDVIVCVHNAPKEVELCLEALVLEVGCGVRSVIMVDDCSNEETKRMLRGFARRSPAFQLITNPERMGYTNTANRGLRHSDAGVRTLLNSDALVSPGWAEKILAKFNGSPRIGIVGPLSNAASYQSVPSIKGSADQTAINGLPAGILRIDIDRQCELWAADMISPFVPLIHGFCYSIARRCLDQVGLFDEESFPMGYGEETDYCIRATDAGFALCVALDTFVYHAKSKSYQNAERVKLMQSGWDTLVARYGLRRLRHAIETMERQPDLVKMRRLVSDKYYRGIAAN
jgi:GT2 family glycosyltransferase